MAWENTAHKTIEGKNIQTGTPNQTHIHIFTYIQYTFTGLIGYGKKNTFYIKELGFKLLTFYTYFYRKFMCTILEFFELKFCYV